MYTTEGMHVDLGAVSFDTRGARQQVRDQYSLQPPLSAQCEHLLPPKGRRLATQGFRLPQSRPRSTPRNDAKFRRVGTTPRTAASPVWSSPKDRSNLNMSRSTTRSELRLKGRHERGMPTPRALGRSPADDNLRPVVRHKVIEALANLDILQSGYLVGAFAPGGATGTRSPSYNIRSPPKTIWTGGRPLLRSTSTSQIRTPLGCSRTRTTFPTTAPSMPTITAGACQTARPA